MYESLTKRLADSESLALLGLFFGQYLMVLAGPSLIVLGLGLWNPFLMFGGLLSLRFLFLFCNLQEDVMELIATNERKSRLLGVPEKHKRGKGK